MSERRSCTAPRAALLIVAVSASLAGCAASSAAGTSAARSVQPLPMTMSLATPTATWAVARTGGRAAGGTFWQLLVRSQRSAAWRLVTPPGVADNGGLVVATTGEVGLVAGFVPSEQLTFTPLAITADDGAHWSQGLLPGRLVASPGALAALPDGRLLAATTKGVEESAHGASGWSVLVSLRTLAATPAGRACGLIRLTAVAVNAAGAVQAAGQCARPGIAVVFGQANGGWQAARWKLTGSVAHLQAAVLRLTGAPAGANVIVLAGASRAQAVLAARLNRSGSSLAKWSGTELTRGALPSIFLAQSGGWGAVTGTTAQYDNAAPVRLPRPGATVAFGADTPAKAEARLYALVSGVMTVTVWQEGKSGRWARTQLISVPSGP